MKSLKSVLAILMAVCLMMCLAVPAFATEATETTTATTEAVETTAATNEAVEDEHDHDHEHDDAQILTTGTQEERSGFASVLRVILIVLEVIISLVLIVVVLLQSGKEAGLSGALSGNNDSYMSKNGGSLDKKLAKSTKWVALAWIIVTLVLALI